MKNENFELTYTQLNSISNWSTQLAKAAHEEGCGVSHEISITFSFSLFGRTVEANCGSASLLVEECEGVPGGRITVAQE